jgi:hypothetical protein
MRAKKDCTDFMVATRGKFKIQQEIDPRRKQAGQHGSIAMAIRRFTGKARYAASHDGRER